MFAIKNYKETPEYSHAKLCWSKQYPEITPFSLLEFNHDYGKVFDTRIYKGVSTLEQSYRDYLDGVYDIVLRNCENVSRIWIESDVMKSVLFEKKFDVALENGASYRIPLAFDTPDVDTDISHGFIYKNLKTVSFIPLVASLVDKITIKMDGKADLHIGAVIFGRQLRRDLAQSTKICFYVNGDKCYVNIGCYYTASQLEKEETSRFCCIC